LKQIAPNPEQITFDQPSFRQWDEAEHIGNDRARRFDWERVFQRLRLMWARREFLLKVCAVGLVVATAVAFLIPARYESEVQLMPPDGNSEGMMALLAGMGGGSSGGSLSGGGGMLGSLASSVLGGNKNSALFMGVLQSRTVEDALIDRFNLRHVYGLRLEIQAEKKLSDRTQITEDRKSGILSVTVSDHNPKRAAALANGYTDELNALMANLSTSSAHRERVFLEGRLNDVSKDLEVAEQDLSQFSSKNATVDVNAQARAMLESSAMLQGQLVAAQSELEGLRQIFTDNNVRVRSTEARIAELKQQIKNMAGQPGAPQSNDSNSSGDASPYPTVRQLPILGVGYADHLRRVKVDEAVFETLTKEYELAKVEEAKEIPTVKVLDAANVPERKSFPPRLIIMAFGTIFAGILGAVFVVASANWNAIDPHDPRKSFANEVVHKLSERYPWMSSNGFGTASNGRNGNGSHD
jgi:capsule polysaccharide export protein KpsE/RkpR